MLRDEFFLLWLPWYVHQAFSGFLWHVELVLGNLLTLSS